MSMSKKDFVALADAVRADNTAWHTIEALADFCRAQNPRFDRERWVGYITGKCGPSGGRIAPEEPRTGRPAPSKRRPAPSKRKRPDPRGPMPLEMRPELPPDCTPPEPGSDGGGR